MNMQFQKLVDIIKSNNDFFNAPIICFPSSELASWFKICWLKTEDQVLMNVNTTRLSSFIKTELLKNTKYHLIDKDILVDLLINYLKENKDVLPLNIKNYIYDNNEVNAVKLYDISCELAKIYLSYIEDDFTPVGYQFDLFNKVLDYAKELGYVTKKYLLNEYSSLKLNKKLILFGFNTFTPFEKAFLKKIEETYDVTYFKLEEETNPSIKVTLAPSVLREVEYLHSTICQLIKNNEASYSDIVVYAPDISKYLSSIKRVFTQDNVNFPNINYCIPQLTKDDNVTQVISILYNIINKGYFTRLDFYSLISNPLVRDVLSLSDDDISSMVNIITMMNVYRTTSNFDDFNYAKTRLTLSKLIPNDFECSINIDKQEYVSFEAMDVDDKVIVKFNNIVDNLESFFNTFKDVKELDLEYLNKLIIELNKWFIKDDESFIDKSYKRVLVRINRYKYLLNGTVPQNTIFNVLLDTIKNKELHAYNILSSGITFTNITNGYIPSKYAFVLGLGSTEFITPSVKSELDERTDYKTNEELELESFNNIKNTTKHLYLSYVNRNLKTDEDYYPSSVIPNVDKAYILTIDEERCWGELYTKREYKSKDYYLGLLKGTSIIENNKPELKPVEYRKHLKASELKSFLEEPFIFKANALFKQYNDASLDMKDEFIPLSLDNLTKYNCVKDLTIANLSATAFEELSKWHLLNIIKDDALGQSKIDYINSLSKEIVEFINTSEFGTSYELINYDDITYSFGDKSWMLTFNLDVVRYQAGANRCYKELKELSDKDDTKEFIRLYIASLIDISMQENNINYNVVLKKSYANMVEFTLTKDEATTILNKLYEMINDYDDLVYLPISLFDKGVDNFNQVLNGLDYNWKYEDSKNMFNYDGDLGFNSDNFQEVINNEINKVLPLLKFKNQVEDN